MGSALAIATDELTLCLPDSDIKIFGELRGRGPLCRRQGTHGNKRSWRKLAQTLADQVAQLTVHTMPNHRISHTLGHDEADLHPVKVGL